MRQMLALACGYKLIICVLTQTGSKLHTNGSEAAAELKYSKMYVKISKQLSKLKHLKVCR